MGEVYRARDERLHRTVALKVLPESMAADADRMGRLQQEARVLAALNHPHVAAIYGVEEGAGVAALVLEFVDGPTLADRLTDGPLPVDETVKIAYQIAEALQVAHERGIVHRDLKPANISLTADGSVKVLDFGLARVLPAGGRNEAAATPTISRPVVTDGHMVLGTAAYMAPEQAKGQPVDRRADVWAFGAIVFELLTGRRAFGGASVAETVANVLQTEPNWAALPPTLPASLRRVVRRCLIKDPRRRLADISSILLDLDEVEEPGALILSTVTERPRVQRWTQAGAVMMVLAAMAFVGFLRWSRSPMRPETRLDVVTSPTSDPVSMAVAPDGRAIAFVATNGGRVQLWLRTLDSTAARPLEKTVGASLPFWSPDGRAIGFFADQRIKVVDLPGRMVRTLGTGADLGGAWNADNVILLGTGVGPIVRTNTMGSPLVPATTLLDGQRNHSHPMFLPDGRHFLFFVEGRLDVRGVWGGALDNEPARRLLDADAAAICAGGSLWFVRQGTLLAQRFDPARLELQGTPTAITEQIAVDSRWSAALSGAPGGPIAYRTNPTNAEHQFSWFDRTGHKLEDVGPPDATYGAPSLSRDGRFLTYNRRMDGNSDIWLFDLPRGLMSRLTTDPLLDAHPTLSPRADRVAFSASVVAARRWRHPCRHGRRPLERRDCFGRRLGQHSHRLVVGRPIHSVQTHRDSIGRLRRLGRVRPAAPRRAPPDSGGNFLVPRAQRTVLTGCALRGVRVGRDGAVRGLRPTIPGRPSAAADLDDRRCAGALEPGWTGAVLSVAGRSADGRPHTL